MRSSDTTISSEGLNNMEGKVRAGMLIIIVVLFFIWIAKPTPVEEPIVRVEPKFETKIEGEEMRSAFMDECATDSSESSPIYSFCDCSYKFIQETMSVEDMAPLADKDMSDPEFNRLVTSATAACKYKLQ